LASFGSSKNTSVSKKEKEIAEKSMFCGKIERKKWQVEMDIVEIILPVTNSILVTKL